MRYIEKRKKENVNTTEGKGILTEKKTDLQPFLIKNPNSYTTLRKRQEPEKKKKKRNRMEHIKALDYSLVGTRWSLIGRRRTSKQ